MQPNLYFIAADLFKKGVANATMNKVDAHYGAFQHPSTKTGFGSCQNSFVDFLSTFVSLQEFLRTFFRQKKSHGGRFYSLVGEV